MAKYSSFAQMCFFYRILFPFFIAVVSGSSSSSKYDPEILKAEIATAKSRVGPLCVCDGWGSLRLTHKTRADATTKLG